MKKDIKKLWVKALRSGEFKQGKGFLENEGQYCALGVLSLLSLVDGQCTYNIQGSVGTFDNCKFSLSYNTMVWAGIAIEDDAFLERGAGAVKFIYKGKETSIQELNDSGITFKKLATIIEDFL